MTLIVLAKGAVTTISASPSIADIETPCVDTIPTWKCDKKKGNGKCYKKRVQKKCPKTCGNCTIACQDAPNNGYKGTVHSIGFPNGSHPTSDNYESCWHVTCDTKKKTLYIKSQVAYKVTFYCHSDEPIEDTCKDKWPQNHCKKCTEEKCKESKHSVLG